jgi:hypothetical protein
LSRKFARVGAAEIFIQGGDYQRGGRRWQHRPQNAEKSRLRNKHQLHVALLDSPFVEQRRKLLGELFGHVRGGLLFSGISVPPPATAIEAPTMFVAVNLLVLQFSGGVFERLEKFQTPSRTSVLEQTGTATMRYQYPSFSHRFLPQAVDSQVITIIPARYRNRV